MSMRKDVAALAGVSESTVTRVLSGGYVSPDARKRVVAAIAALDYKPNAFARALRTRQTGQIACMAPTIDNPFFSEIILGIEEIAIQHGYVLTIYSTHVMQPKLGAMMLPGRQDALIVLSPGQLDHWLVSELRSKDEPMVVFWDWGNRTEYPSVIVDLEAGLRQCVQHLLSQGHRQIGYLGYEPSGQDANPRLQGFYAEHAAHGLPVHPSQVELIAGTGTFEEGYKGMGRLIAKNPRLTSVVASNDLMAIGAIRLIRDVGRTVPGDISVVGCDDIPVSAMYDPALTTLRIPKREVGNELMRLILTMLRGEAGREATHVVMPSELMVRGSTAAPKG